MTTPRVWRGLVGDTEFERDALFQIRLGHECPECGHDESVLDGDDLWLWDTEAG